MPAPCDITNITSVRDALVEAAAAARRPRRRRLHAGDQRPQADPHIHRRGIRSRRQREPAGQLQRAAGGRAADDAAGLRQHRAVLVDPIDRHRARPVGVLDDQGRHRATGANGRDRVGRARRARQCDRPGRDRDAAHRADQGAAGVVQGLRRQDADEALGQGGRNGGPDGVPAVRCGELRHRNDPVRRRRMAGERRTVLTPGF